MPEAKPGPGGNASEFREQRGTEAGAAEVTCSLFLVDWADEPAAAQDALENLYG